jgi:hypothetical protein
MHLTTVHQETRHGPLRALAGVREANRARASRRAIGRELLRVDASTREASSALFAPWLTEVCRQVWLAALI